MKKTKQQYFDVDKFGKLYETKMVVPKSAIQNPMDIKSFKRKPGTVVHISSIGY